VILATQIEAAPFEPIRNRGHKPLVGPVADLSKESDGLGIRGQPIRSRKQDRSIELPNDQQDFNFRVLQKPAEPFEFAEPRPASSVPERVVADAIERKERRRVSLIGEAVDRFDRKTSRPCD
jgi:hypothetical protein